MPDRASPNPPANGAYEEVLDVIALSDGNLLAFGSLSGAYVLAFDATRPMSAPPAWARTDG